MQRYLRAALAAPFIVTLAVASPAPEETFFVQNGMPGDVFYSGPEWETVDGALTSLPGSRLLTAGLGQGTGDFTFTAELTISKLQHSAASFVIDYENHFVFESNTGMLYVEGPIFGGTTRSLGPTPIEEGKPFRFGFERRNQSLVFTIDKEVVYSLKAHSGPLGTLSFRPWRSTMAVRSMFLDGAVYPEEAPPDTIDVFVAGTEDYNTFRIPSILLAPNGHLLAFAEGRKETSGDSGDIDIVLKRSTDNGATWSPAFVLVDEGTDTCGNPCPVVDETTGTIFLLFTQNRGDDDEASIHAGTSKGTRTVWVMSSADSGGTWTDPVGITRETKAPDWRWYATGPGIGIQLKSGPRAGRLVVPCDHSYPTDGEDRASGQSGFGSHAIYSDDNGKTWVRGEPVRPNVNECQVVELESGELMLNMRSYAGENLRRVTKSSDGGRTWGEAFDDPKLVEPVCQASILRYTWSEGGGRSRVLFANPASKSRKRMTVRMSYDEGRNWPVSKLVYRGSSAYSCLVALPDQSFGLLFEVDGYTRITYAPLTLEWLTGGMDSIGNK